jgi:hypothetical protein
MTATRNGNAYRNLYVSFRAEVFGSLLAKSLQSRMNIGEVKERFSAQKKDASCARLLRPRVLAVGLALLILLSAASGSAQNPVPDAPQPKNDDQINVNWLYGSYVPKEVPLESLPPDRRFKLYIRQTYTTVGIYIKTTLFTIHDQVHNTYPEWGDGFDGFAKRFGTRQAEFIIQNSVISLGDGLLGWEPRYDRCRCEGFWPRTRHAISRNFVTYDVRVRANHG